MQTSNHKLFDQTVFLDKDSHTYKNADGVTYIGFTEFYKNLIEPFPADMVASRSAKDGQTKEDVLKEWADKRDLAGAKGTAIDNAIKSYLKGDITTYPEYADICKPYENYNRTISDIIVYSDKYKIATEIDLTCLITNRKDSWFDIVDFKSNEQPTTSKYRKWLKEPFDFMTDSTYVKTCWQLSYGAFLLESLSGKRCRRLYIHYVPADNIKAHEIIPVMYMKNDLLKALDLHRSGMADPIRTIKAFEF